MSRRRRHKERKKTELGRKSDKKRRSKVDRKIDL